MLDAAVFIGGSSVVAGALAAIEVHPLRYCGQQISRAPNASALFGFASTATAVGILAYIALNRHYGPDAGRTQRTISVIFAFGAATAAGICAARLLGLRMGGYLALQTYACMARNVALLPFTMHAPYFPFL